MIEYSPNIAAFMKKDVLALYANMAMVPKKNNLYFFLTLEKSRNPFIIQVISAFANGPPIMRRSGMHWYLRSQNLRYKHPHTIL